MAFPVSDSYSAASGGVIAGGRFLYAEKSIYSNGVWTWFSDPRAVYYNGSTYIGSITQGGSPTISKYVHATGVSTQFILHSLLEQDDHNNPSIYIRPDGRIVCFYSKHSTGTDGPLYRISTNPEDITAWDSEVVMTGFTSPTCYTNPHYLSKTGKLYMFYRAGISQLGPSPSAWSYKTTTDFSSWSAEQKVMQPATSSSTPYYKMTSNGYDRIDIVATSQHPVQGQVSIYHVYMQLDESNVEHWYKSDGTKIVAAKPFLPASGTLVYDGSTVRGWIWEIAYGEDGHPRIVGTRYPANDGSDIRYMHWRWTGSAWVQSEITTAGVGLYSPEIYYTGGICFDSSDVNTIYLSKPDPTVRELQVWKTTDDGATWAKVRNITSGTASGQMNGRPYSPRNHHSGMRVVWWQGTYTTYINYMTAVKGA